MRAYVVVRTLKRTMLILSSCLAQNGVWMFQRGGNNCDRDR